MEYKKILKELQNAPNFYEAWLKLDNKKALLFLIYP